MCKRTGREQDLSGAPSLHPFLGSLRSMNSSVQRNKQTMYDGNMKGFCLNQTEDCTPGDRCSDSSEELLH